jgi:hypothetical protein
MLREVIDRTPAFDIISLAAAQQRNCTTWNTGRTIICKQGDCTRVKESPMACKQRNCTHDKGSKKEEDKGDNKETYTENSKDGSEKTYKEETPSITICSQQNLRGTFAMAVSYTGALKFFKTLPMRWWVVICIAFMRTITTPAYVLFRMWGCPAGVYTVTCSL